MSEGSEVSKVSLCVKILKWRSVTPSPRSGIELPGQLKKRQLGPWTDGSRTIQSQGWMICWYTFVNSVPRRQHSRKFDGTCISKSNWIHPQIIFNIIYCLFKVKKTLYLYRMNTFTWPNRMHIFSVSPHNIEFSLKSHKILVKWAMRLTNIS